ncbi:tyrosine recombinase XerC [Nocardia sp. NPDC051321]|uniref:tyrosine recombinase XerC n=1 Tax=Nocardia sp. NPDC051321 TaxID=3364323 RepID=UPI00379FD983
MPTPRPRPRKDGTVAWQVYFNYYDTGGIRRQSSETFNEYGEALLWADRIEQVGLTEARAELAGQRHIDAGLTLLVPWLIKYADRRLSTGAISAAVHRKYLGYIHNDIARYFGERAPLEAVTQDTDAAWIVFLSQDIGNKPKTVQNKHGFLSAGLRAAVEERPQQLLSFNPCSGTRLPPRYDTELDIFDSDEWELFWHLIIERWQPQAEFGLVSMARPSEVGALLKGDINATTGAVRINKAWKDSGTKLTLGKPKTKRGVRTVNVPLSTIERLDLSGDPGDLLFHTRTGRPITASYFHEKAWQPALKRLEALAFAAEAFRKNQDIRARAYLAPFTKKAQWRGTDPEELIARYGEAIESLSVKHLTPYTLRHTAISWKLQDGVELFVVSRDAGHESTFVTDRVYGHNDRRSSEAAAAVIAKRLPAARAAMVALAA